MICPAHDRDDLSPQFVEVPHPRLVQVDRSQASAHAGLEADLERRQLARVGHAFAGGGLGHLDVEVAFRGDDLEGHDEKDEQQEDDVDHRRHYQRDFLVAAVRVSDFHRSCTFSSCFARSANFSNLMS
jgi:hypothetical protein